MVSAGSERSALVLQGAGRPGVCCKPPAFGRGVVDRTSDEWMPKPVAARHFTRGQQVGFEQRIQCAEARLLLELGGHERDVESHRVAHHGRRPGEALRVGRQGAKLLVDREGNPTRHIGCRCPGGRRRGRPRQLLEVEGIASRLCEQGRSRWLRQFVVQQTVSFASAQGLERQPDRAAVSHRARKRIDKRGARGRRPEGQDEHHPPTRRPSKQIRDQLQ